MSTSVLRPDSPDGDLIDNLVTDVLDAAMRQVQAATETVGRLDQYPELRERYGEGGLRLIAQWAGPAGRTARADLHRALRERGMSQRQIAAVTGVSPATVNADLRPPVQDRTPAGRDDAGYDAEPVQEQTPATRDPLEMTRPPEVNRRLARNQLFERLQMARVSADQVGELTDDDRVAISEHLEYLRWRLLPPPIGTLKEIGHVS